MIDQGKIQLTVNEKHVKSSHRFCGCGQEQAFIAIDDNDDWRVASATKCDCNSGSYAKIDITTFLDGENTKRYRYRLDNGLTFDVTYTDGEVIDLKRYNNEPKH